MTAAPAGVVPPQACTCTRMVVADLAGTLDCPAGWYAVDGIGWIHVLPARLP